MTDASVFHRKVLAYCDDVLIVYITTDQPVVSLR